jgi:broad specificity phosphatase PhoE
MKTVFFVRHGESHSNIAGLVSGAESDVPLTDNGRQQAKKAGEELKAKNVQLVICSPLSRTVETAEIIAKELGYDPTKIIKSPLFIERQCGIYEGGSEKIYFEDLVNDRLHDSVETTEQMYKRLTQALESLKNHSENRILVVSHGGASRAVQAINQKLHHSKMYKLDKISNAEIYEFVL